MVSSAFHCFLYSFPLAFLPASCQYVDMVCLYCGSSTAVTNSRHSKRNNTTWRRRRCKRCDAVFTTNEYIDLSSTLIVSHSGNIQPFVREKLFISIFTSCGHRASALADAIELTNTVIQKLTAQTAGSKPSDGNIHRSTIIKLTHQVLLSFDAAAASHYAAYHKNI